MNTLRSLLVSAASVLVLGLVGCSNGGGPSAPDIDPNTPPPSTTPGVIPEADMPKNLDMPAPAGVE